MPAKINRNGGAPQRSRPLSALPKLDAILRRLNGINLHALVHEKIGLSKVRTVQINLPTAGKPITLIAPEDKAAQCVLIKHVGRYLVLSNAAEISEHCGKLMKRIFCIADHFKIFEGVPDEFGLKVKAFELAMARLIRKHPVPDENKPKPMFPEQEGALENSEIADDMISILKTEIDKMIKSIERK